MRIIPDITTQFDYNNIIPILSYYYIINEF